MTFTARHIHKVPKSHVTIRDYRRTGLCPPSGGRISPQVYVEHIPVIKNAKGIQDGITLGNVLRQQGLAVQNGTDSDGNVFLFTKMNELCYQARGSNFNSTGTEHMHALITEPWTKAQMQAAAWLAWYAHKQFGIPFSRAVLSGPVSPGATVPVLKKGFTTHQAQAIAAGWRDRSDPGDLFDFRELYQLAKFFGKNGHF